MDLGISGRVAVVTGASAGVGFAVAQELLANGALVMIAARDPGRLHSAKTALLEQPGAKVGSIAIDVSAPGAAEKVVDHVISTFGSVDILVNNAGRAHSGGLMGSTEEDWDEMTTVKLTSTSALMRIDPPMLNKTDPPTKSAMSDSHQTGSCGAIYA
jgi:3-oxoacyl-[acyl-carrier protein] reductase